MPELGIDPGHAGNEAVGLDRAQDRPRLRIDLVDSPRAILSDPERSFSPGEARVAAAAGCRDRREHATRLRVDLLNAVFGDLIQVPAVEGGSRMRGGGERAHDPSADRIERVELVAGCKPDVPAIVCKAMHVAGIFEGTVLAHDCGCRSPHLGILIDRQRRRE